MLSLIIGSDGIKMDPKKVEAIMAWPVPTKVKKVQSFLGLANFYRCFVNNFSKVAKPLHELTHKDKEWNWTDKCQTAFENLRTYLYRNPYCQWWIPQNRYELSLTPLSMPWAQSFQCYRMMASGTLVLIYQKGSMIWNVIMMYMIRKWWVLYMPWRHGDIILRVASTKLRSGQIIATLSALYLPRNWIDAKLDGPCIYQDSISTLSIRWDHSWLRLMSCWGMQTFKRG